MCLPVTTTDLTYANQATGEVSKYETAWTCTTRNAMIKQQR
jgi:hypothetical protein